MNELTVYLMILSAGLAFIIGHTIGFIGGRRFGYQKGRDAQWCDDEIARHKRELLRHGRDGKFCQRTPMSVKRVV